VFEALDWRQERSQAERVFELQIQLCNEHRRYGDVDRFHHMSACGYRGLVEWSASFVSDFSRRTERTIDIEERTNERTTRVRGKCVEGTGDMYYIIAGALQSMISTFPLEPCLAI